MTGHRHQPTERLRIQCWCGNTYGHRSITDIRAGRTFSCSPGCTPDCALTRTPTGGRRKKQAA